MLHWILLGLAALFAALAVDAYRLRSRATHVPVSLVLKDLGHDLDHLPLAELEPAKRALQLPNFRTGPSTSWAFGLLALLFAVAALLACLFPA